MDKKTSPETQIRNLLKLDEAGLERELVQAVSGDVDFLASLSLPMTVPPQPAGQVFESMAFADRMGLVKLTLRRQFERDRAWLKKKICDELHYCRQKSAGEVNLVCGIFAAVLPHFAWIPIIVVYLYKNRFFDELCECDKKK